MNVPGVAKKTFDELKDNSKYSSIVSLVLKSLMKISKPFKRARLVHQMVDEFNEEIFSHPIVKQYSPCAKGCSACCHTQVSVTEDEAILLVKKIEEGAKVDLDRLRLQARAENHSEAFYKMSFEDRKCIFLSSDGDCGVYADRPSVCRTNAVLGNKEQCDTSQGIQSTRIIKTEKSDMAIYASFLQSQENGTLPFMVSKILRKKGLFPFN